MKTLYHLSIKIAVTFLMLISVFVASSTAQPQYYNYNDVGVSSNTFPFGVVLGKEVQWLCLPNEFTQPSPCPAGNITKLYFYMTGASTNTLTNLTIKLGQTDITTLPTGAWYTGQLDTVYHRATVELTSSASAWMSITLDRPFSYNPSQSLVIDIQQCAATSPTMTVRQNGISGFRRSYSQASTSCPFPWGVQDANIANCGVDVAPVGIVNNNNQVPDQYSLAQNYPNPFNPVTNINFALPKSGHVELKIFDVLGIEVATLVNEFKPAGSYSVDFNAAEFPSGHYFYSIQSGDFSDSKKMMLIK